ncbi:AmmeMemoRadiSam system protein A [Candidatus Methylomicrobium oryzae]|uniref:AmmeMemoRadiSam system protein A n=1 Tax=Candidatus Methylomicrobium oryzae TaxID=2802053 RepID=UPI0019221C5D|nr:AmmeMemoRadiSam system protein A [Methylomicrobium sp. RS1]MBL1265875.1 AmmeMemoRadiSam system protein A [Methylomicrobium sp. RS1]
MNPQQAQILLDLAKRSIRHGLETDRPLKIDTTAFPPELLELRATFVTLHKHRQLRGCIGMLKAVRPLAEDIAENAFAAAFRDYRFPPLSADEFEQLEIHLSILTPPEPIAFKSEEDLLAQLRPGEDGLILEEGGRRGTFLPSVWENLPDPKRFLRHLKQKAGLPADYWSENLRFYRYRTESVG